MSTRIGTRTPVASLGITRVSGSLSPLMALMTTAPNPLDGALRTAFTGIWESPLATVTWTPCRTTKVDLRSPTAENALNYIRLRQFVNVTNVRNVNPSKVQLLR